MEGKVDFTKDIFHSVKPDNVELWRSVIGCLALSEEVRLGCIVRPSLNCVPLYQWWQWKAFITLELLHYFASPLISAVRAPLYRSTLV